MIIRQCMETVRAKCQKFHELCRHLIEEKTKLKSELESMRLQEEKTLNMNEEINRELDKLKRKNKILNEGYDILASENEDLRRELNELKGIEPLGAVDLEDYLNHTDLYDAGKLTYANTTNECKLKNTGPSKPVVDNTYDAKEEEKQKPSKQRKYSDVAKVNTVTIDMATQTSVRPDIKSVKSQAETAAEDKNEVRRTRELVGSPKNRRQEPLTCHYCHKIGHRAFECKKKLRLCYGCGNDQHYLANCKTVFKEHEKSRKRQCYVCGDHNHIARYCGKRYGKPQLKAARHDIQNWRLVEKEGSTSGTVQESIKKIKSKNSSIDDMLGKMEHSLENLKKWIQLNKDKDDMN